MNVSVGSKHSGSHKEEILDRLLALSPKIYEGPVDTILIPLAQVSAYWKLSGLKSSRVYVSERGHPFLEKLGEFRARYGLNFCIAPTAPWALWLLTEHPPQELLEVWDLESFRRVLVAAAPASGRPLLSDLLENLENRAAFEFFLDSLDDLGVRDFETLLEIPFEALSERFGPLAPKLLRRVRGSDDLQLKAYEPSLQLSRTFHPRLERLMGSDESPDIMERFQTTLASWEDRLHARRQLLRGLRLRIRSERRHQHEVIFVQLPRPTRSAASLFAILREKWLALSGKSSVAAASAVTEGFEDEIDDLVLESLGLETDVDAQLDLFDPKREERTEAWNTLIGRLLAKSTHKEPVRVGSWRPVESYLPERSCEWIDSDEIEKQPPSMIQEHPKRPLTLLREPRALTNPSLHSESEFLGYIAQQKALATLERITDLWSPHERRSERSYARIKNLWVFWDSARQRAFVHGYFEIPTLSL